MKLSELFIDADWCDVKVIDEKVLKNWAREKIKELENEEHFEDARDREIYGIINWIKKNILEEK